MDETKPVSRSFQTWSAPAEWPTLAPDEVQVWRASLDQPTAIVEQLRLLLSPIEQARADRFHFKTDCERFTVARACLRTILGRYLQTNAALIEFGYSEHGKPHLLTFPEEPNQVKFNLAHSDGWAMYAFTRGREIGIDLERMRPEVKVEEIARRFFSATETKLLDEVPAQAVRQAFFNCWTRKEAFIKAKGAGLSLPLNQFDVTLFPLTAPVLLRTRWNESEASHWSLQSIDVGAQYVGAVAVEGHDWTLSCWLLGEELLRSTTLQTN
jgi:4'-phosphopantetheinyl transferase